MSTEKNGSNQWDSVVRTTTPTAEEDGKDSSYCTSAVTGSQPAFQAIFVCNECFHEGDELELGVGEEGQNSSTQQPLPLCICQACADICHDGDFHEVDYVGMGPATCDCFHSGNCQIHEQSLKEVERLGIPRRKLEVSETQDGDEEGQSSMEVSPDRMMKEIYELPSLCDAAITENLIHQATKLIMKTKETHWLDQNLILSGVELSELELLAWNIYQRHLETYSEILGPKKDVCGAEWWVQVKPLAEPSSSTCGIDLHYDKDEALAESFGLGSFPTLSTVTYLTGMSPNAPPTTVFDHTYTQGEDEVMSQVLVSRPRRGKHLVFDGRLLHGAPYHVKMQPQEPAPTSEIVHEVATVRVTFLVNIWKDRRPANVQVLDDRIRQFILKTHPNQKLECPIEMVRLIIPTVQLENEEGLPDPLQERIALPFVSDKGTVSAIDPENTGGLVVLTFPPPPFEDSILVMFGPGMQAYLEYAQDEEEEEMTTSKFIDEQLHFEPPSKQSQYV
ncbi:hypothetical protein IV203_019351 [Nitzschia inconspicua]|uniref:Uncharacterized protein n=1 Tax=Nitzschia inconspicua TaxID=303405 RepID=A0A9K3Q4U6_9STRA|nr:hypothetical protein IV203_019351 [Nitzschia inconspicua]